MLRRKGIVHYSLNLRNTTVTFNIGSSISSARSADAAVDEKQAKRLSRLFQATLEVVASEYKYLLDLAIVRDAFIQPLNKAGKTALVRNVFSVWENMLAVHDKLLQEMMAALPDVAMLRDTLGALPRGNQGKLIIQYNRGRCAISLTLLSF